MKALYFSPHHALALLVFLGISPAPVLATESMTASHAVARFNLMKDGRAAGGFPLHGRERFIKMKDGRAAGGKQKNNSNILRVGCKTGTLTTLKIRQG